MWVVLLTDIITNKSEKRNLLNAHAPSREPVPLMTYKGELFKRERSKPEPQLERKGSNLVK